MGNKNMTGIRTSWT